MTLSRKNKLSLLFILFLFNSSYVSAQKDQDKIILPATVIKEKKYDKLKKTIAIINFSNASPEIKADAGKCVTDMLVTSLTKSGKFIVIEREKLDKVLAEQILSGGDVPRRDAAVIEELEGPGQMAVTGIITPKTAVGIGKILYADVIITGRIINFGLVHSGYKKDFFAAGIEACLISAKTGKTLFVDEAIARSKHEIDGNELNKADLYGKSFINTLAGDATREAVELLTSKIDSGMVSYPWEGYVIRITNGDMYISGGEKIGLKKGGRIVILEEKERIEDKATGSILKRKFEPAGQAEIIRLEENYSVCRITRGENIKENYIVQLEEEYEPGEEIKPEETAATKEENAGNYSGRIDSLWRNFSTEIYGDTREHTILPDGSVYFLPYKELSPKAYQIFGQIESTYRAMAELTPDDYNIYRGWSAIYTIIKAYNKAIPLIEKAVALKPDDPDLRRELASCYRRMFEEYYPSHYCNVSAVDGIDILTVIYHRNDNYAQFDQKAKEIWKEKGVTQDAIQRWRWEYIRNEEMYLQLAGNKIDPEQKKQAIESILTFININIWGNYDKCIVTLTNITKNVENNPLAWNTLGTAYGVKSLCEKNKEYMDRAEECVKKAVELNPENPWYREQLAIIYSLKGGFYTNGGGVSAVYLLDKETGLGYEPKFLYSSPAEREKYKQLAEEQIVYKDMLSKKECLAQFEETKNKYPELYKKYTPEQLQWYKKTKDELEELKERYPNIIIKDTLESS